MARLMWASREPEVVKAFRDTWELGIHSYLTYLRDRLTVARELLRTTGSICVQIGDENLHLVRSLMDEVFGSQNFEVTMVSFKKTSAVGSFSGGTTVLAGTRCDYLIWFATAERRVKYRQLFRDKDTDGVGGGAYRSIEELDGTRRPATERRGANEWYLHGSILPSEPHDLGHGQGKPDNVFEVNLGGKRLTWGSKGWKTNRVGDGEACG